MHKLFSTFKKGLQRTKTALVRNIQTIFTKEEKWNADDYDDLEAALIASDLGVQVSMRLVEDIRDRYQRGLIETSEDIIRAAKEDIVGILDGGRKDAQIASAKPAVILLVGVNGSGKTTSAGKLAHMWKEDGETVMLAACDTFRAAAVEQIKIWGERVGCPVVSSQHGADAASVAFDAVKSAQARGTDKLIIDTAGRQHTRRGLMEELAKVRRTIAKACPGAPHETWLVVDGSTGTNALIQAREFSRVAELSGLCVTKLDGSSKGGVVVAITEEMSIPLHFVGLGEGIDDLQPFDSNMFADAMFEL